MNTLKKPWADINIMDFWMEYNSACMIRRTAAWRSHSIGCYEIVLTQGFYKVKPHKIPMPKPLSGILQYYSTGMCSCFYNTCTYTYSELRQKIYPLNIYCIH